jgi:hypothetical protein
MLKRDMQHFHETSHGEIHALYMTVKTVSALKCGLERIDNGYDSSMDVTCILCTLLGMHPGPLLEKPTSLSTDVQGITISAPAHM